MTEIFNWIAMIEIPVFAGIFKLLAKEKQEVQACKDALGEFKLHVARNYVSINYLKDIEHRITDHLLRIEKKLDEVGKAK